MKSRLEQVLEPIEAKIRERFPGVTFKLGEKHIAKNASPPRIVWVRDVDGFGPAVSVGRNPRAVLSRSATVVAHVWAKASPALELDTDDAATEYLVDVLAWAMRAVAAVEAMPQRAAWLDSGAETGSLACLVEFTLSHPVVEPARPTATPTSQAFDPSDASPGDGKLDAGADS